MRLKQSQHIHDRIDLYGMAQRCQTVDVLRTRVFAANWFTGRMRRRTRERFGDVQESPSEAIAVPGANPRTF